MYSLGSRANAIFAHSSYVVFVLLFLNVLTTKLFLELEHPPTATLTIEKIDKFRKARDYGGNEIDQAVFTFNLEADLRPVFNWNTKQLFAFLVVEFETEQNKINQVVVWDRIIRKKEDADLNLKGERVEYPLADQYTGLRKKNVTISLMYNTMPITGLLTLHRSSPSLITKMPSEYI